MDPNNTQPAWASRAIMAPLVGLVFLVLRERYGLAFPVEAQGFVIDLVPTAMGALLLFTMYARKVARKIVDRWL